MSDLSIVDQNVEPFDTVTLNPEGRVNYDDGRLTALYPKGSDVDTYRVALFHYDDDTVSLPDDSVVLEASEGVVTALVPEDAYAEGDA